MEFIRPQQYIERYSDQEAVFRVPLWGRVSFLLIDAFLAWISYLWIVSAGVTIHNWKDAVEFAMVGVPLFGVTVLFLYAALPHTLRLDFQHRAYEEIVGVFPFTREWRGSFDDIRSTYVEERPGTGPQQRMYQIGLVWQGKRARRRISMSGHRYRFACAETREPAQDLAQAIARRLQVPYDGIVSPGGKAV